MATRTRNFLRDEGGAVAIEALIITPILAWLFVASFIFFDAFRTYNTSVKATYAIADVLSRQTDTVYGSDIDGMAVIFQHISRNLGGSDMRVSEIWYSDSLGYYVEWSHPTGTRTRLRDTDIPSIQAQLPNMVHGESVIVVETFLPYVPFFDIGLNNLEFENFTVTRPRFAGFIDYDDGTDPACNGSCDFGEGDGADPGGSGDSGPSGS